MTILKRKSQVTDTIPTASMADIAFLLLFFFLVTTVFPRDQGLRVVLPEDAAELEVAQRDVLYVEIQSDGTVQVRRGDSETGQTVLARQIEQIWRAEFETNPNIIAAVRTHPDAAHQYMISVLDALQMAGARRISLQVLET